jgi:hypothetical protein
VLPAKKGFGKAFFNCLEGLKLDERNRMILKADYVNSKVDSRLVAVARERYVPASDL